jgi:hypothetical protein
MPYRTKNQLKITQKVGIVDSLIHCVYVLQGAMIYSYIDASAIKRLCPMETLYWEGDIYNLSGLPILDTISSKNRLPYLRILI